MNQSAAMGTERISKLMWRLGMPAMLAQLVNMLYNIVDKIFLGHMEKGGVMALGGLGVVTPIIFIIGSFAAIVSGGGPPLASIALGKDNKEEAERIFGNAIALLFLISVVSVISIYSFKTPLLRLFGASEKNIAYADEYLSYYLLGTFFAFTGVGLNGFISAQGRADIAMRSVLVGAVSNILLDPIFIYVLGMGVKGAAIATVLAQFLSACSIFAFFYSPASELKIRFANLRLQAEKIKRIAALGVSHFVMQSTEAAVVIVMNRQFLAYGNEVHIAAFAVMRSINSMLAVPLAGFNNGMQPIMAYNYGAGNTSRIKEVIKRMLVLTMSLKFLYQLLITLFPALFASIFTKDAEAIAVVSRYMPVLFVGMGVFSIQVAAQNFFVSTNKPKTSLFVASLRKVVLLIPLALLLPNFLGLYGVFLAEGVADTLSGAVSGVLLGHYYKKL